MSGVSDENPAPKKKGRKAKLDPELVAAAIVKLRGNLASVARKFKVDRKTVQDLIGKRPNLQSILEDTREGMLDDAESALYKAVLKGQGWAVCFFLKTQGKKRGYQDKPGEMAAGEANNPLAIIQGPAVVIAPVMPEESPAEEPGAG